MENILEVKNVSKEYKNFKLDNISFNLEYGYIMGFIGPNGAGKSTTIKLIMNLASRNSGDINIFGMDNIKYERQIKEKIGFVYDESHFYEDLKLKEMKNIISPFYKNWDDKKFSSYMKRFDLDPDKKISQLSKGMKMKYSLAIALSHNAELILMDEPTSGLDPVFRSEILDILYELIQDERKSVFFSTHITADLEKIADYITFINNGRIIFSMPKDKLFESYGIVKGNNDLLVNKTADLFLSVRKNSYGFEALTDNINSVRTLFKDRVVIEKPTLDDIMVHIVKGERESA